MTRIKTVLLGTALTVTAGAAMAGTPVAAPEDPVIATPVTPVMTTSENWVAEMESEIREFDQLTAQHGMPSSAPGAGWKQSMEEELELHLSKT